ncbi:MAG: hypothetical protein ABI776_05740, partial [Nocardioidaceae bacterium]
MSTLSPEPVPERPRTVVRRALVRFVAAGSLALLVVSGTTVVVAQAISKDVAVRHAKSRGITFAQVVSAPLVDDGVRAGGPGKLDVFSRVMRSRLKDDSMVHIKVWDRSARIIWADEPSMRGQVFPFEPAVAGLPSKGGAVAAMSELDKAENVLDGPEARLLEVYVSTLSADGEPIIVETYWSTDQIDEDARA